MVRQRKTNCSEKALRRNQVKISTESINDTSCSAWSNAKYILIVLVTLYVAIPILICLVPQIVEQAVYMNLFVGAEERKMLHQPTAAWNLSGVANFHVQCGDTELGVWHLLPNDQIRNYNKDNAASSEEIESQLQEAENVIVYHHGNGMTRATGGNNQRRLLYKVLQAAGYHVITFDYRGFGDSMGWPSEVGLVNDSICIYDWLKKKTRYAAKIVFWGHSLGAAVSTLAGKKSHENCDKGDDAKCHGPDFLILEGAFTNLKRGAEDSGFARGFLYAYPKFVFDYILSSGLSQNGIVFANSLNIGLVKCPVMLLHADDDAVIPVAHSEELYHLLKLNKEHDHIRVKLVKFKAMHGYGHMDIYKAPELPQLLSEFLNGGNEGPTFQVETL